MELPEFYVPWPARRNPLVDAARVHSKAWAVAVGILPTPGQPSGVWDEASFDGHDYAGFCSLIHPDASLSVLELMTDWNVWAFFVDDTFAARFSASSNREDAKKYLDGIVACMPLDLVSSVVPDEPTFRALVDLWTRTAGSQGLGWRKRIVADMRRLLDAFLWELDNLEKKRLANPAEYIAMRRQVGAALWSADLVEYTVHAPIPERLASSRPFRVLRESFADAVHLRNDLFSYHREVEVRGEMTNAVLVMERFFGVETPVAMELVNDLLTSRLQQFEATAAHELVELFVEFSLSPPEQKAVVDYVRGLQDWQSGAHEWHRSTSRYLNPGKTVRAFSFRPSDYTAPGAWKNHLTFKTLGLQRWARYQPHPLKKVGPVRVPPIEVAYPVGRNGHLDEVRARSRAWARSMGFFDQVWDESCFDAADIASFHAEYHPGVGLSQLLLETRLTLMGTYADDYFFQHFLRPRDLAGGKAFVRSLGAQMEPGPHALPPSNPVEAALRDLWPQLVAPLSSDVADAFRFRIRAMFDSWLWELELQVQRRIADPVDYWEMRRRTGGAHLLMVLSWLSDYGVGIPQSFFDCLVMQEISACVMDHAVMINDLYSYQKEVDYEDCLSNGVVVLRNFLDCDVDTGLTLVNKLMTARLAQFEFLVSDSLPTLMQDWNLTAPQIRRVGAYFDDVRTFLAANARWHQRVDRYREGEVARTHGKVSSRAKTWGVSHLRVPGKSF